MAGAYSDIARVLRGARLRQVRIVLLAAAAAGVAGALLFLLAGAVALASGARPFVRIAALAGAATAILAAGVLAIRALLRSARDDASAARTVAGGLPALRSALLSSVELARSRSDIAASGHFSVALVDAHLERTAADARGIDLARAIPDRRARQAALLLVGVAGLHLIALVAGGTHLAKAYGRVLAGDPPGTPAPQVDPITGDVELTYAYPAYMKREARTLSGTGGEIRAPKGTEVTLRTRADRPVKAAEIEILYDAAPEAEARPSTPGADGGASGRETAPYAQGERRDGQAGRKKQETADLQASGRPERSGREAAAESKAPPVVKRFALAVSGDRDLQGRFLVDDGGSYRFRFLDAKGRTVAEGPTVPIALEPDAFPQVRITAPEREIEVSGNAVVQIVWDAEDDFGLSEVALVLKGPTGKEERRILRRDGLRRDGGTADLALVPLGLGEGDELAYWMEAVDTDTVSGPKKSVSDVQRVKIYSEAEHRRQVLERARQVYEELVALLGDRLDGISAGPVATPERLPAAQALDTRTRLLAEAMRDTAREIRRDRAGPREVAAAISNVAGALRSAEQRLTQYRNMIARSLAVHLRPDGSIVRTMAASDAALDAEMEKGILYLEQLLDKRRAEDLVRLAKDLQKQRRDLANLMEKFRSSPSDERKKELLAQIGRMKERVRDLLQQMAELSKGFNDEHMNEEALAEMAKSQDMMAGLDEVEQKLAKGDLEGAMKALDQMANAMDKMLAGLQRTAGMPDEKAQALMKDMLAFKEDLEKVQAEQKRTADETEKIRADYRRKIADKMKGAEKQLEELSQKAKEAREDVDRAQPGVSMRAEPEYEMSKESLRDLERALAARELEGAAEAALRAQPSVDRLSTLLQEDAQLADRSRALTGKDPQQIDDARRQADKAAPKVRQIRDALAQMFPDPRSVLGQDQQRKLEGLSKRQVDLERQAGQLQQKLRDLAQQAPVFPPSAENQLSESRRHMGQAGAELGAKNPQRGHGEQELALDALDRFKKGLEEAAKKGQGGGGQGFPFPFAEAGGEREGDGRDPSREKVKIPGAEAHKVPEEFRKDLLEAMKQGAPERYKGEVQRYYEELVK
ncbi:hypothetical protein AMOR_24070 [Anaeromyxobacter oryzae]|uniref:DUF4175 family protein n=2 Tax=Anaeromyxobacter oryzae TaxID=2918170 RepID=A0ABM7WV77_9BACT|nr:hypothetical protein AMOR_24070 [Anaeromyxobacter oryzae]